MTFDQWLSTLSPDAREDLDIWSALQGWLAAMGHMNLDHEAIDLLRKMQPIHTEEESE